MSQEVGIKLRVPNPNGDTLARRQVFAPAHETRWIMPQIGQRKLY